MTRYISLISLLLTVLFSSGFGPFHHIAVAEESFERVVIQIKAKFPTLSRPKIEALRPFYRGGAVGPDIGFFPEGEMKMSLLSHYLRSGDLTSELLLAAKTPEEYAFAIGWRTHVDSDVIAHKNSVNRTVAEMLGVIDEHPEGVTYGFDELAHNRVEAGADLKLLRKSIFKPIKYPEIKIPLTPIHPKGRTLIEEAYLRTYGIALNREALFKASEKINDYIGVIPEVFVAMGYLKKNNQGPIDGAVGVLNNITIRPFFLALMKNKKETLGSQAILNPYILTKEQMLRHEQSTNLAIQAVSRKINQDPNAIPNRNLDTGDLAFQDQFDPSEPLLKELENRNPEKVWELEYPPALSQRLIREWRQFLSSVPR